MDSIISNATTQARSVSSGVVRSTNSPGISNNRQVVNAGDNQSIKSETGQVKERQLFSDKVSLSSTSIKDEAKKLVEEKEAKNKDSDKSLSEQIDEAVSDVNSNIQGVQRNLQFSVDQDLEQIVVNVTDKKTDKIIRQIPSEDFLELARNLKNLSDSSTGTKKSNEGSLFSAQV